MSNNRNIFVPVKKFLVTILALIYLAVSSGVAIEVHYCMGKIAGVDLYGSDTDHCGKCGMKEKKGGCCNDEFKFFKLKDSHKNVDNTISFTVGEIAVLNDQPLTDVQFHPLQLVSSDLYNHSPPKDTGPSICILNCVFRI